MDTSQGNQTNIGQYVVFLDYNTEHLQNNTCAEVVMGDTKNL